ncbi:hypothetical protein GN958_ATG18780 [Phytophthora infestans]|uniref:Uncharacterized protein n=1 Tax=Phytophthora infestans TaxID=4787 RepID=A0A8S9TYB7_PHYIN|nr:hypothetical protein GN958_ATG18780 [Phytophthora infestans]
MHFSPVEEGTGDSSGEAGGADGVTVEGVEGVEGVVLGGEVVALVVCPLGPPLPLTRMSAHVGYVWLARSECQ